jgi:hypothetical protein
MKPTKRESIVKLTSEKLNLDNELVDTVVVSFYGYLNKTLASLDHTHVHVPGLGLFKLRKKKVLDAIIRQERTIAIFEQKTSLSMMKYSTLQDAKDKLEKLKIILVKINQEEERKKELKEKRKSNE